MIACSFDGWLQEAQGAELQEKTRQVQALTTQMQGMTREMEVDTYPQSKLLMKSVGPEESQRRADPSARE